MHQAHHYALPLVLDIGGVDSTHLSVMDGRIDRDPIQDNALLLLTSTAHRDGVLLLHQVKHP